MDAITSSSSVRPIGGAGHGEEDEAMATMLERTRGLAGVVVGASRESSPLLASPIPTTTTHAAATHATRLETVQHQIRTGRNWTAEQMEMDEWDGQEEEEFDAMDAIMTNPDLDSSLHHHQHHHHPHHQHHVSHHRFSLAASPLPSPRMSSTPSSPRAQNSDCFPSRTRPSHRLTQSGRITKQRAATTTSGQSHHQQWPSNPGLFATTNTASNSLSASGLLADSSSSHSGVRHQSQANSEAAASSAGASGNGAGAPSRPAQARVGQGQQLRQEQQGPGQAGEGATAGLHPTTCQDHMPAATTTTGTPTIGTTTTGTIGTIGNTGIGAFGAEGAPVSATASTSTCRSHFHHQHRPSLSGSLSSTSPSFQLQAATAAHSATSLPASSAPPYSNSLNLNLHHHTQTTPSQSSSSVPPRRPVTSTASSRQHSSSTSSTASGSGSSSSDHLGRPSTADTTPIDDASMPSAMALDDEPVLSFWGPDPVPLPSRFARIKRNLIAGHEEELERCWARLIHALRPEVEQIGDLGAHLIPSIEFSDIKNASQAGRFGHDLRRYGVGVVRKVVPKNDADDMVNDTSRYLDDRLSGEGSANGASNNRGLSTNGAYGHNGSAAMGTNKDAYSIKPPKLDPTCYDFFWTPAQVRSRAHPNVLQTQRFMMGLWETSSNDRLAKHLPISYVDRIRIHGTAKNGSTSGGGRNGSGNGANSHDNGNGNLSNLMPALTEQQQQPQSTDDWLTALQSSAGVIAQVDNGSLERWEPDGYQRGGTYDSVFHGHWEDYDPWECASRVPATMDLYNGYGACTIFRMFQGVLALSTIEPGMIRLLPSPKLATSYYLLRPFFSPRKPAPDVRSGPEWEEYLDPSNWRLERDPDTIIHGAVPGHAQRITEHWHPHLYLRSSMITLPTLQPGDYIFWHPDLPYHISSNNPGLKTPSLHDDEISMLVYIPAAPLTQTNALYLARQRKAFQRGHPGPDFDSSARGAAVENPRVRPGEKEIEETGGEAALRAMGLAPWDTDEEAEGSKKASSPQANGTHQATTNGGSPGLGGRLPQDKGVNGVGGTEKATVFRPHPKAKSPKSQAEADIVRLSNIILFPERSMMGYSV